MAGHGRSSGRAHEPKAMIRCYFSVLLAAGLALAPAATPAQDAAPLKTLRYAFRSAETGFDPAQTSDLYSATINANLFEAPLTYDYLARPVSVKPQTAAAMPEMSADFRRWTVRIRPGIYFADDPAFGGKPRELTAQDYVYSIKRHYDPRHKSGRLYLFEGTGILGLSELRRELMEAKKPFDYDREVEGLRAPDRYTLEVRFAEPQPRFSLLMADGGISGAVAREVIEALAPSGWRSGCARRRSCWSATPGTGSTSTMNRRRQTTPPHRPSPAGSRAGACR
jgi:ABC-type transport system substrate-binding protein